MSDKNQVRDVIQSMILMASLFAGYYWVGFMLDVFTNKDKRKK